LKGSEVEHLGNQKIAGVHPSLHVICVTSLTGLSAFLRMSTEP